MNEFLLDMHELVDHVCTIFSYRISHSELIIATRPKDKPQINNYIYIVMESVKYINAPTYWEGCHLQVKENYQLIDYCKDAGIYKRWLQPAKLDQSLSPQDIDNLFLEMISSYKLYTIKPDAGKEIEIIAETYFVTNKLE